MRRRGALGGGGASPYEGSVARFCARCTSRRAAEACRAEARRYPVGKNIMVQGTLMMDVSRKELIGKLMCAYNPHRMPNASIRIGLGNDGESTCMVMLYENGRVQVAGTRSIEEAYRGLHALRELAVSVGGATFARICNLRHTNGVYIRPAPRGTAEAAADAQKPRDDGVPVPRAGPRQTHFRAAQDAGDCRECADRRQGDTGASTALVMGVKNPFEIA